jgi:hypothetical protein
VRLVVGALELAQKERVRPTMMTVAGEVVAEEVRQTTTTVAEGAAEEVRLTTTIVAEGVVAEQVRLTTMAC